MKPFCQHVAIAVDGGGIKGVIGIAEAAEFIAEIAEGAISASSVSFSGFSDSPVGRWLAGCPAHCWPASLPLIG